MTRISVMPTDIKASSTITHLSFVGAPSHRMAAILSILNQKGYLQLLERGKGRVVEDQS
jgi:hypothetical protein